MALESKVGVQKHWIFNRMVKKCHWVRIEKDISEIQNRRCKILTLLRFLSRMTFQSITLTKVEDRNRYTTNMDGIEKVMYVKQANHCSYTVTLSCTLASSYG
jgi:hypothetical protein